MAPGYAAGADAVADDAVAESWWARLRADLGRRIEQRGAVLWYLIIERGFRGLLFAAIAVWALFNAHMKVADAVGDLETQVNLNGGAWWQRLGTSTLHSVLALSPRGIVVIALIGLAYGVVELSESVGLLMRRRWAEYLVVIATSFGIPLELLELARHPSPVKLVVTVVNIAVVIYLVVRKRLFQFEAAR